MADRLGGLFGDDPALLSGGVGPRGNVPIAGDLIEIRSIMTGSAVAPVIGNFVPAVAASLGQNGQLQFDVTDIEGDLNLASNGVFVSFDAGASWELVYTGTAFGPRYSTSSTVTAIANGVRFVLRRRGGWPSATIRFDIRAIDTSGNEAA